MVLPKNLFAGLSQAQGKTTVGGGVMLAKVEFMLLGYGEVKMFQVDVLTDFFDILSSNAWNAILPVRNSNKLKAFFY